MFLAYEHLDGYIHGLAWLRQQPNQATAFAQAALDLLTMLNRKSLYHLDLWAGNIMLRPDDLSMLKAIDLENCHIGDTAFLGETLGYQCAFLYQYAMNDFIAEADYDALVFAHLDRHEPHVDMTAFMPFYTRFKTLGAGRKERRLIPTKGLLIPGKPAKRTTY